MLVRKLIFLLLFIIVTSSTSASVFTVTSIADAGRGTLRDALTLAAANGVADKDFIVFNLPNTTEAARIIRLVTQLPDVSSNLAIDASTQPGGNFGVSKARVTLALGNNSTVVSILNLVNVTDVSITGIAFRGNWLDTNPPSNVIGINAQDVSNIDIGAVSNGNLFNNLFNAINFTRADHVNLRGNITGLTRDGLRSYKNNSAFVFSNCKWITIGGGPTERNIFSDYSQSEVTLDHCQNVDIKNNYFGTNYTGNAVIGLSFIGKTAPADGLFATGGGVFNISDNVLSGMGNAIYLSGTELPFEISNNRIGVGASTNTNLNNRAAIIIKDAPSGGNILNNIVAYNQDGIVETNSKPVTISNNSFYCNLNNPIKVTSNTSALPFINVISKTSTDISGTATPNSKIELFFTDDCNLCQGKIYITTVVSGNDGAWSYSGTLTGSIVGTATNSARATCSFSSPSIGTANAVIKNTECGADGSIKGLTYANATTLQWTNMAGNIVGAAIDLVNVPVGKYRLTVDNGTCPATSDYFEIKQNTFAINSTGVVMSQPSCGLANGRVSGLSIVNAGNIALTTQWTNNATGVKVSDLLLLENAAPGSYTLHVKAIGGCERTYGPITLRNLDGPKINQRNAIIAPSPCGQFTGSVRNITVTGTGTIKYSWKNQFGTEVSTTLDLFNKPGGKYQLEVTDDTHCAATLSTQIEIPETNGVSLNTTNGRALSASCEKNNGSVLGLQATGATQITWTRKADNVVVGSAIELKDVPAGDYVLTLANATCSKTYDFTINALSSTIFPDFAATVNKTCFAFNSGSITINTDGAPEEPAAFRWVNSAGDNVAFGKTAQILPEGNYKLYLTNRYGCENLYKEYTVGKYSELLIAGYGTVANLKCGIGIGGVTATVFTGGTTNYVYQWYDANDVALPGKTNAYLDNVPPGKYRLNVTDGGCSRGDVTYTIRDDAETPNTPTAGNVRLPFAGTANIKVNDPYPTALYRLYDSPTAAKQIDEQRGGTFNVRVTASHSYYVTLTYGYCESARTEVKVIVDPTANGIANTFTPNGDGVNDYWQINGFDATSDGVISVLTRDGKLVYQSKGYAKPFDGTYQGKQLPAGVYFYTVDLHNGRVVSGNVTILR